MLIFLDLKASYLQDHTLQLVLVGIFFAVTLLAGAYPAFYISRFNATSIFRGAVRFGGRNLFSRFLLGVQIVIIFITLITSIAFARNAAFNGTMIMATVATISWASGWLRGRMARSSAIN